MSVTGHLSALDGFRRAVVLAFPDRPELAELRVEGTLAQAWQAYSHFLGITGAELARRVAPAYGIEAAKDLNQVESRVLALVPFSFCQAHLILPLRLDGRRIQIATANPLDRALIERVTFLCDLPVVCFLAPPQTIDDALAMAFAIEANREANELAQGATEIGTAIDEHAIVKLGRALMSDAVGQRASDLHIQPFLGAAAVRIRVDGVLRRLTMLPDAVAMALIRHVKATGGMDPTNSMLPQDGRGNLVVNDQEFDLRISTLPSARGERLVIRFLDQSRVKRLSGAGFSLAALQTLRRAIARPSGMVILTGPTGSGKTSTLYGMLAELNHPGVNIITVENPVEYRIPGIFQVEVNEKAGRTFGAALRSILRQDPDIILIGEIRDAETAEIATQAALTGHLVLSTLHTNDALTAIPRLLNLGVAATILADSLVAIASQRLCRQLCPHCRVPASEPYSTEEQAFFDVTRSAPAFRRVGCAHCDFTGFRGRLPVVDIIEMTPRLRDAIAAGEAHLMALDALREGGLKSLAVSGAQRVISGDTTVREVADPVGPSFWSELAAHFGAHFSGEMPDTFTFNPVQGQGVLLLSRDAALAEQLATYFAAHDMRLVVAKDAESAEALLRQDEAICYVIRDSLPDATVESLCAELAATRRHLAWTRLPSAVLIEPGLESGIDLFREAGSMASFLTKPVNAERLLARIRRAEAR